MYEMFITYGTRALELFSAFAVVLLFINVFGLAYQLKQMTALDLIINFILASILGGFIANDNLSTPSFFITMFIYIAMVYALNQVMRKSDWGRRLLVGTPKIIIEDGKLDPQMLDKLNIGVHEIASALRRQKIHSLAEVKMAQIEPGGDLTIVKKGDKDYSVILIDNGIVDQYALKEINRSEKWLRLQLAAKKVKNIDDVFIAQWYRGRLHITSKV